jgi:polynucleotide 5'-hydroxyl-kinase GRC3/NOL9
VLVLGDADTGKSTLCRFLLGHAARTGRRPALLDLDLGQKMVGPPACVTLGRGEDLKESGLAFVGATEPVRALPRVLAGIERLAGEAACDLLLGNGDGLLRGPGRRLKAAEIAVFRPDLVVALGRDEALEAVLADHPVLKVARLPVSPRARRKTRGERRRARREAFERHFAGAGILMLPQGGEMPPPRLLVALTDEAGRDLALGIVLGAEPGAGVLSVWTAADPALVVGLRRGEVALDEAFHELPVG